MEQTDDTNRTTEDSNWKERFKTISRKRAANGKAPWKNGQEI